MFAFFVLFLILPIIPVPLLGILTRLKLESNPGPMNGDSLNYNNS